VKLGVRGKSLYRGQSAIEKAKKLRRDKDEDIDKVIL
jgi:hypothetical protein